MPIMLHEMDAHARRMTDRPLGETERLVADTLRGTDAGFCVR
jgi:hypothetical protein